MNNNDEYIAFLSLRRLPGRLSRKQAGWLLGMNTVELQLISSRERLEELRQSAEPNLRRRLLSQKKRLPYLGRPGKQAKKYYLTRTILAKTQDARWLERAKLTVQFYWQRSNRRPRKTPTKP